MFILRFIGRILSIGFILFIVFVISGKSARADDAFGNRVADYERGAVTPGQIEPVAAPLSRPLR